MKKIILLSTLSLITIGAQANAPAINWTGIYAGINGGYGWAKEDVGNTSYYNGSVLAAVVPGSELLTNANPTFGSAFGGAQIGYNYNINNQGLVGLEAQIDGGSFGANYTSASLPGFSEFTAKTSMDWIGTVKAKAGFFAADALIYATGGFAIANEKFSLSDVYSGPPLTIDTENSQTRTGWTVGAGVEYPIYQNLTILAEYQYISFGSKEFTVHEWGPGWSTINVNASNYINAARLGLNYHFCL